MKIVGLAWANRLFRTPNRADSMDGVSRLLPRSSMKSTGTRDHSETKAYSLLAKADSTALSISSWAVM